MTEDSGPIQVVSGDGKFDEADTQRFISSVKLHQCGVSYAVVAIIGPQSSGKSTLLNHLFGTKFSEMDASQGRNQTTKGILMDKAEGIEPFTVVMDVEGVDSGDRGEDDATFEKQSTLFALAVADTVIINIWCHDIGREFAANTPLQKTVFQVMMRLFRPSKTTLLYVIRDKTETPFEHLESRLREDIQKIWETISKPEAYKNTPLSEIFNVEVTALSSYYYERVEFKEQVAQLRQRYFPSTSSNGHAGDRRHVIPASAFYSTANQIWKTIKQNKDLDIPALRILVAAVRCEEIANEKLSRFASDEEWAALKGAVNADPAKVSCFGNTASMILKTCFSGYDEETQFFDKDVRNEKRHYLESKALELVYPSYKKMLRHLRSSSSQRFKTQLAEHLTRGEAGFAASVRACQQSSMLDFDQGCADVAINQSNWDDHASKVRDKIKHDNEAHSSDVRREKLSELVHQHQNALLDALARPVESLFASFFISGGQHVWTSIRILLNQKSDEAALALSSAIAGFELDQATLDNKVHDLKEHATKFVERKTKESAREVLDHMKKRFVAHFMLDKNSLGRVTGEETESIRKEALHECLKLLSTVAVIRLDESTDNVEDVLFSALMSTEGGVAVSEDRLASITWNEVSPEKTLITPAGCKALWKDFLEETDRIMSIAIAVQDARRRSNNKGWTPNLWAILGIIGLGLEKFMEIARDPHCLHLMIVVFLIPGGVIKQLAIPGMYIKVSEYIVKAKTICNVMKELRKHLIELNALVQATLQHIYGHGKPLRY